MRNAAIIAAAGLLICAAIPQQRISGAPKPGTSDRQDFKNLQKLVSEENPGAVKKESAVFFKAHPDSPLVPDVRLLLAEIETSPEEAVVKYRDVVSRYRNYQKRSYAQYRICEIVYLQSKWEILARDAREGRRMGKSPYAGKFTFFLIIALIHTGDYAGAEQECRRLIDTDHDYRVMARSLLMLAHILRSTTGFSREYIATIRDIALGYAESDAIQAVIYMLGEFYENRGMHDEAYSAYLDLVSKYPGSPEAAEASRRIQVLIKNNPRRVFYMPDKKILDTTEKIDIHPEAVMPEDTVAGAFYSISVGPLASAREAAELKKLLKEFDSIKTVKLRDGYALYVGKRP